MAKESHNFKFDIYLLMITENAFIVILGLQGHKRMGKTCAPNKFCFLRHPSMHSIKNISERNKIDTQSRTDAYNRRKRLISKSDYNFLSLAAPKSILETEKPYKTLSSG
jgi:hypothetical protein